MKEIVFVLGCPSRTKRAHLLKDVPVFCNFWINLDIIFVVLIDTKSKRYSILLRFVQYQGLSGRKKKK